MVQIAIKIPCGKTICMASSTAKLIRKPLKGFVQTTFDELVVNNIVTTTGVNITQLAQGEIIEDTPIIGSSIGGQGKPDFGIFTNLTTIERVLFEGSNGKEIEWDYLEGVLYVVGDLVMPSPNCARFGDIKICDQTISNPVGNIVIKPNEGFDVQINGGFSHFGTGNFRSNVSDGYINLQASQNVDLISASGGSFVTDKQLVIQSKSDDILISAGTQGSNAVIELNAENVAIPENSLFVVGPVCNTITGNTQGMIVSTCEDLVLNIPQGHNVKVPGDVKVKLDASTIEHTSDQLVVSSSAIRFNGNMTTSGDSMHVHAHDVQISDPIVTIGGVGTLQNVDSKDRGVEYRYNTTGETETGWFGWKNDTNRFTFFTQSFNQDEVITGTLGSVESNGLFTNSIQFMTRGTMDLNCGELLNVSKIQGCEGPLNVLNDDAIVLTTDSAIVLDAEDNIVVNGSTALILNDSNTSIKRLGEGVMELYASDTLLIRSNVQIRGTVDSVYSTVVRIEDPIISIGGVEGRDFDDNKDRGVEFTWYSVDTEKTGFFGFKDDTQRFTFIPDGVNNDEVFSGDKGDFDIKGLFADTVDTRTLQNVKTVAMVNGGISGVKDLSGGSIEIITTEGNISLSPTSGSSIVIPNDVPLVLGEESYITSTTSGSLFIASPNDVVVTAGNQILLNGENGTVIGNDEDGAARLYLGNTSSTYIENTTNGNLRLAPEKDVLITDNTRLVFSDDGNNYIYGNTEGLFIVGEELRIDGESLNMNVDAVNVNGQLQVSGKVYADGIEVDSTPFIYLLGSFDKLNITSIINHSHAVHSDAEVLISTAETHQLGIGAIVTLRSTNSDPVIDGTYSVTSVVSDNSFTISPDNITLPLNLDGTSGIVRAPIAADPGKDVGIQVNWHTGSTSGTMDSKTGFFGFKRDTKRWTFYKEGTNTEDVFNGTLLGDVEFNKGHIHKLSGFELQGGLTAGTNLISGANFMINGGSIDGVTIGSVVPSPANFTNLSSTNVNVTNGTLLGNLNYSVEHVSLGSNGTSGSLAVDVIVSFVNVEDLFETELELPSGFVDGQLKTIIAARVGNDSSFRVMFGNNSLLTPFIPGSALTSPTYPSKILFKRQGQSVSLVWNAVESCWIPIGGNGGKVM